MKSLILYAAAFLLGMAGFNVLNGLTEVVLASEENLTLYVQLLYAGTICMWGIYFVSKGNLLLALIGMILSGFILFSSSLMRIGVPLYFPNDKTWNNVILGTYFLVIINFCLSIYYFVKTWVRR